MVIRDVLTSDEESLEDLVCFLIGGLGEDSQRSTVSFILAGWHPYIPLLKRIGFHQRAEPPSYVIVHAAPDFEGKSLVLDSSQWFMTVGDRDI